MVVRAALYLAQIRHGRVEIYRDDGVWVDAFDLSSGQGLCQTLVESGWRPRGQRMSGGEWAAILVEPTDPSFTRA
jgi:hypothetical protein